MESAGERRPSGGSNSYFLGLPGSCSGEDDDDDVGLCGIKPKSSPLPRRRSSVSSDDSEWQPPASNSRRVSFADAFGLSLVSVKQIDPRAVSPMPPLEGDLKVPEEYFLSTVFTPPATAEEMAVRVQQQKMELESVELLTGTTTLRGIVRVLNVSFHKVVFVRTSLDGWSSHFDLLAEYIPGSSDGDTDRFSFKLILVPPFGKEGARVEFCLRYETSVGTFWANNGDQNYVLICHQKVKEAKEKSHNRGKNWKSCLKTNSQNYTRETNLTTEIPDVLIHGEVSVIKPLDTQQDHSAGTLEDECQKLLVENSQNYSRRHWRRAARLARVRDYFSHKEVETPEMGGNGVEAPQAAVEDSTQPHYGTPSQSPDIPKTNKKTLTYNQTSPLSNVQLKKYSEDFCNKVAFAAQVQTVTLEDTRPSLHRAGAFTAEASGSQEYSVNITNTDSMISTATGNTLIDRSASTNQHVLKCQNGDKSVNEREERAWEHFERDGRKINESAQEHTGADEGSTPENSPEETAPYSYGNHLTFGTVVAPLYHQAFGRMETERKDATERGYKVYQKHEKPDDVNPPASTYQSCPMTQSVETRSNALANESKNRVGKYMGLRGCKESAHQNVLTTGEVAQKELQLDSDRKEKAELVHQTQTALDTSVCETFTQKDSTYFQTESPLKRTLTQIDSPLDNTHIQTISPLDSTPFQTESPLDNTLIQTESPPDSIRIQTESPLDSIRIQTESPLDSTLIQTEITLGSIHIQTESPLDNILTQTELQAQTPPDSLCPLDTTILPTKSESMQHLAQNSLDSIHIPGDLTLLQDQLLESLRTEIPLDTIHDTMFLQRETPQDALQNNPDPLDTIHIQAQTTLSTTPLQIQIPEDSTLIQTHIEDTRINKLIPHDITHIQTQIPEQTTLIQTPVDNLLLCIGIPLKGCHEMAPKYDRLETEGGGQPLSTSNTDGLTGTHTESAGMTVAIQDPLDTSQMEEKEEHRDRSLSSAPDSETESNTQEQLKTCMTSTETFTGDPEKLREVEDILHKEELNVRDVETPLENNREPDKEENEFSFEGDSKFDIDKNLLVMENYLDEGDDEIPWMDEEEDDNDADNISVDKEEDIDNGDQLAMIDKIENLDYEEEREFIKENFKETCQLSEEEEKEVKGEVDYDDDDNEGDGENEVEDEEGEVEEYRDEDVNEVLDQKRDDVLNKVDQSSMAICDFDAEKEIISENVNETGQMVAEEVTFTTNEVYFQEREQPNKDDTVSERTVEEFESSGKEDGDTTDVGGEVCWQTDEREQETEDNTDAVSESLEVVGDLESQERKSIDGEGEDEAEDNTSTESLTDDEMELYMHTMRAAHQSGARETAASGHSFGKRPSVSRGKTLLSPMPSITECRDEDQPSCPLEDQPDTEQTGQEARAPLPPVGGAENVVGRNVLWWREFFSFNNISRMLIYTLLFVVFSVTAYYYDFLACFALYLFSVYWLYCQGRSSH